MQHLDHVACHTHWQAKIHGKEIKDVAADKKTLKDQWLTSLVNGFGDDEGNEVNFNGTVVQALMMMNGKDLNDAISRKEDGTVARAVVKGGGPDRNDRVLANGPCH